MEIEVKNLSKEFIKEEEKNISSQSMVPIKNIGHTSFHACNMEAMLHFYCDILGMEQLFSSSYLEIYKSLKRRVGETPTEKEKKLLSFMFSKGDEKWVENLKLADRQYLELFYDDGQGKEVFGDRNDYYGYFKLNFEVKDIEKIKNSLVDNEVELVRDIHKTVDGSFEITVHDPDGNEVQFTEYSDNALHKLGIDATLNDEKDTISQVRYTTQVAYHVCASEKMKQFYCDGLGLKTVHTITYGELFESLQQNTMTSKNSHLIEKIKAYGNRPWVDYLEVAPHQYIEFFYDYNEERKERRDLSQFYGYQHLCLEVDNIQDAWQAVIANGLTPDTQINLGADRSWQFWLVDPDGNRLELMQYTAESKQLQ